MSQCPKMGLFGSKDKETKKETKDGTPDRYAPYCIDSDSETYDTEALSMMDINDIIGIQSEPVSESTLESEIAALSEIITESRTDVDQGMTESNDTHHKDLEIGNIDMGQTSDTSEQLTSTLKELEDICRAVEPSASDVGQLVKEDKQFSIENTMQELYDQQKYNLKDNCEVNELVDIKTVDENVEKMHVECIQSQSDCTSLTSEVKNEENVNKFDKTEQKNSNVEMKLEDIKDVAAENENGIKGSLQLIGEAYSSEDSQEMTTNDTEPQEINSPDNSKEDLVHLEDKKVIHESCELEENVNIVSEAFDSVNLVKTSTIKNDSTETFEKEVHSMAVDAPTCSTESKHAEELPTLENKKDILLEENKENILLQESSEDTTEIDEKDDFKEVIQEKEVDMETREVTETMEVKVSEAKIETVLSQDEKIETVLSQDEKIETVLSQDEKTETVDDTIVSQDEKCETIVEKETQEVKDHEIAECMDVERKESHEMIEECMDTDKEAESHKIGEECMESRDEGRQETMKECMETEEDEESQKAVKECMETEEDEESQKAVKECMETEKEEEIQKAVEEYMETEKEEESEEAMEDCMETEKVEESQKVEEDCMETEKEEESQKVEEDCMETEKGEESQNVVEECMKTEKEEEPQTAMEECMGTVEAEESQKAEEDCMETKKEEEIYKAIEDYVETEKEKESQKAVEECMETEKAEGSQKAEEDCMETENEKEIHKSMEESMEAEKEKHHMSPAACINTDKADDKTEVEYTTTEMEESQNNEENTGNCQSQESVSEENEKDQEIEESVHDEKEGSQEIEKTINEEKEGRQEIDECMNDKKVIQECKNEEKEILTGGEECAIEEKEEIPDVEEGAIEEMEGIKEVEECASEEKDKTQATQDCVIEGKEDNQEVEDHKDESERQPQQCQLESTADSDVNELQELSSLHTNDKKILQRKSDSLELLQTTEEMQENSTKSSVDQSSPKTNDQNLVSTEDTSEAVSQDSLESSSTIENLIQNAVNETDIEMQTEDNTSLDLKSLTTEMKELPINESEDTVMETSISQEKPEQELKTFTSENDETSSKFEAAMEVNDTINLNSPASVLQSELTAMDTSIPEDDCNNKIVSVEENNDINQHDMEITNAEVLKIEDTTSAEQNLCEIKDISTVAETSEECTELKDSVVSELLNEQTLEKKEDSTKVTAQEESTESIISEPKEPESTSNVDKEEISKPSIKDHEDILQNKGNVQADKTEHDINDENQISESIKNDEILVPEEEKMNVILEGMEVKSQSRANQDNFEEKSVELMMADVEEDVDKKVGQDTVTKMDIDKEESINIENPGSDTGSKQIINSDNIEDSISSRNEESLNKELEDDDSKNDDEDSLKNVLEITNNVEEMFSEEQCPNTQDIVTSILDDVRDETDFKNILSTEAGVTNEIEKVLQQSVDLPLVEAEVKGLPEKLPQDSEDILNREMEDSISNQNIDSLEGLLGLDLIPEGESSVKTAKSEVQMQEQETLSKDVDMSILLEQSNSTSDTTQASDYITDVISSCLTDRNTESIEDSTEKDNITESIEDKSEDTETVLKVDENLVSVTIDKESNVEDLQTQLEANSDLPENELDMDFEDTPLESVADLVETEPKLELDSDILLQNVDQAENLSEAPLGLETSQPSSEISELESAVKFLQESEEQAIDSPLVLSPKMVESVVDDISKQADASSLFVPGEDICDDASELVAELQNIETDSISISEAEIISEAAKLESERKLAEQEKLEASMGKCKANDDKQEIVDEEKTPKSESEPKFDLDPLQNIETQQAANLEKEKESKTVAALPENALKPSESIPKVSILEERLKEPPKIEIPIMDITKVSISPTTSKDSLLIPKDAKLIAYQKMLESPKLSEKSEPKIMDTPRKDSEGKHDFENVGSPRIILKIAKSAITDCGEPRSPKSPKIRSATNSPNPEDSPGQKLGKIKLKLSKGGHPSIISNENIEEAGQWHSEGSSSLSPIGMKIKLSKSGDVSIVSSEKHEFVDDSKEGKHKFEEMKRTESPIGMKIKLSKSGDASIVQQDSKEIQMKHKDKLEIIQGSPKRTESPIGMKIKLSKSGDASIIQLERQDPPEEHRDCPLKAKEKLEPSYDSPKRTDSPIGMKIKLSKTGDASIVSPDVPEESREAKVKDNSPEIPKRTESPIGMKIKLSKTKGGASIISMDNPEESKEKLEIPDVPKRTESPLGMKIKLSKTGDASIVHSELQDDAKDNKQKEKMEAKPIGVQDAIRSSDSGPKTRSVSQESLHETESQHEPTQKVESPIGMKIKLSKFGDVSIVSTDKQEQSDDTKSLQDTPKRTESPIGMKIKLSKTGDASIIQPEASEEVSKAARTVDAEHSKVSDSNLGMKIKLLKTGDASIVESEKKERQQRRRDTESPLEMKIKLSKTGHPTIVACDSHGESAYKGKEAIQYKESPQSVHKEPALKILKTGHSTILQSNRSELTIEPVQMQNKKAENMIEISPKRKEITIAPIEPKKSKLETQLTQILPEVTIQPVSSRDQKQFLFDPKSSAISRQQMNVISQEISITQVRPTKPADTPMTEKLKDILGKNVSGSPMNSDCEIIEHRPELIIVNENSNSSQDVVIIEEVPPIRMPEVKVPKKRGRPRRNPMVQPVTHSQLLVPRDPLSLDEQQPQVPHLETRENERPKRTCRSQKSYAPPKRGRGRGRGKRKLDSTDTQATKKPRIEQDLTAIEASTTAVITVDGSAAVQESFGKSPELYKALKQPPMDTKVVPPTSKAEKKAAAQKNEAAKNANVANSATPDLTNTQSEVVKASVMRVEPLKAMPKPVLNESKDIKLEKEKKLVEVTPEKVQKAAAKTEEKSEKTTDTKSENKDILVPPGHSNWLTPTSKKVAEGPAKHDNVSTIQVIDEETRMSAESGSRSQTPARNISAPASETIVNEESQGSVLSTATTESEKVKVKNRRMEINFDPDEGPFTVDKIAEYEWPLDRKGETFMIQEQISQYLGVKSFKRKYPDLKRRVVDMEERNYLRENGLVSEAMCDMGLTAICSSEVLDVMCSDFPDQYEEYRKHMREKQVKEHSKKQKELTAAANAEKNRIDLAEMAVQSALAWNVSLNKARRETRKCSLDLQTFTIHVPKKQQKIEAERKIGHYPVALIPGQYTDYYREYTPAELRYYPLNTVLYGPMRPNERKFDSQSEGSQSDSDSDSSSDDSSSSSSEGTQDTEGSQSTMDDVDMEIVNQKDEVKLKCKMCLKTLNKHSKAEVLIQCGTCNGHVHPSCIDLTLDMVPHIQSYAWQCTDCKTCAQCHDPADEDKMLFCDMCDRGYHIYCVGLRRVPQGRWHCQECAVCANCGSREPGGLNSDRNSVAQWQHEYKKGDKNTRVYVSTLCVPCSKVRGDQGGGVRQEKLSV